MIRFKLFIFPRKTSSVFFNAFHIKKLFYFCFQMQKEKWKSTFFRNTHEDLFY